MANDRQGNPTHIMPADYFTKPLQGEQFRILREWVDLLINEDNKKET